VSEFRADIVEEASRLLVLASAQGVLVSFWGGV
jgi:hypothetical protein